MIEMKDTNKKDIKKLVKEEMEMELMKKIEKDAEKKLEKLIKRELAMGKRLYTKEEVVAIEPKYVKGKGNMNIVHLKNGEVKEDKRRIQTIMKNMAMLELFDLKLGRKLIEMNVGISKNIPYVFDLENIFVAVKTRVPIGKNDGAMSFVKLSEIVNSEIEEDTLLLSTGSSLKFLEKASKVQERIRYGKVSAVILDKIRFIL